jgi:hypothetical protein
MASWRALRRSAATGIASPSSACGDTMRIIAGAVSHASTLMMISTTIISIRVKPERARGINGTIPR